MGVPTTSSRPRRRWRILVLIVVQVLIGVALFEGVVRIFAIDYNINPNWKYHPVLGWSQVPLAKFNHEWQGKPLEIEFNSKGFRDVEHEVAKPPDVKRVVVIGDSFCEALQVNLEDTFYKRLEGMLNQAGQRWETINLGVGDFGTTQEWIALDSYGLAYKPDIVILAIFPLNDVGNNAIDLAFLCKSANDRYRPYFVKEGDSLRLTSAQPVRNFLRRHLVAYGVLEHWVLKMTEPTAAERDEEYRRTVVDLGYGTDGPLLHVYRDTPLQPPAVAAAWEMTEAIVTMIARRCREAGIAFVPVVIPFEPCIDSPATKGFWEGQPPELGYIKDYPEKRFARLFETLGVPAVLLKPEFDKDPGAVLPYIDGHLNPGGHRVAAEAIFKTLRAAGIVR